MFRGTALKRTSFNVYVNILKANKWPPNFYIISTSKSSFSTSSVNEGTQNIWFMKPFRTKISLLGSIKELLFTEDWIMHGARYETSTTQIAAINKQKILFNNKSKHRIIPKWRNIKYRETEQVIVELLKCASFLVR